MVSTASSREVIRFGVYELDVSAGELRKRGVRLPIQGLPVAILAILVESPGTVITREELRKRLWPPDTFVDFDHSIRNGIARLREVLEDSADSPRYIETLPRRGYRFIAQVETPTSALSKAASPDAPIESPGQKSMRSPKLGIAAAIVALALLACTAYWLVQRSKSAPIRSVAVLPFKNLSNNPDQEYFADGITESLIGRLSSIRDLRVISRTSVMTFKNSRAPLPEIANALNVDAIVEGSVIREGNRVRIHAQLIRARTDEHFWSESYDRDLGDALALEAELAQAIAGKVAATITGEEHARIVASRHVEPEVYENYLKGTQRLNNGNSRADLETSIGYFQNALKLDPTFAPAYVGLAEAYDNLGTIIIGVDPSETRPKVVGAARRALELDPQIADAHVLLGGIYQKQWQWSEAEAEYREALELNPNDAAANDGLAIWMLCQGRTDEAIDWARRARALDPLGTPATALSWILFQSRRYDEAIRELRSALALRPDDAQALWNMGFVLVIQNKPDEAIPLLEKAAILRDRSPGSIDLLSAAYARAGRRADALRLVGELKDRQKNSYVPAGAFIIAYLGLGDDDEAFVWLKKAYLEQSNILQFVKVHPLFDPLRKDPRFVDLVNRVGLN